jgi:hypothetical protein
MNELARERNISDRVYTKKCVKNRYFDYIKPYFSELLDEEKEKGGSGKGRARRRLDRDGAVGEWRCRMGGSLKAD